MYSTIFPYIMDNKIILGYNRVGEFCDGIKFCNTNWFTSLSKKNPGFIELSKRYDDSYVEFDNYDAINVDRTEDIPSDYSGVMGVPITFLEKWNKNQFYIVGLLNDGCYIDEEGLKGSNGLHMTDVDGNKKYARILIKRR